MNVGTMRIKLRSAEEGREGESVVVRVEWVIFVQNVQFKYSYIQGFNFIKALATYLLLTISCYRFTVVVKRGFPNNL